MFTINKKYFCAAAFLMLLCVTSAVTSCKDDDEASQSYNFLESFGPCPVARGGELIFLGKDLSSVQSVEFPGGETVAPNFSEKGKFTVIVPSSAQPGYLILHTSNGDIKTVSEIGYSEPVTVSKFSPSEQRPGGEVTISGEYLSNATEISIGQVKISLDEESEAYKQYVKSVTNTEITFVVPAEAATDELSLKDGQPVKCGTLTVTLPKFASLSKEENVFPGKDEITISGSDLDLVTSLSFENGIELTNFNASGNSLVFVYPANAKGVMSMHTASGMSVETKAVTLIAPKFDFFGYNGVDETVYDPGVVYKLGSELTFTGENLDLIKSVSFGGGVTEDFTVGADGKSLLIKIPAGATVTNADQESGHLPMDDAHSWGRLYSGWQSGFVIKAKSTTDEDLFVGYAYAEWGSSFWGSMGLNAAKDGFDAWPGTSEDKEFIQSIIFEGNDVTEEYKTTGKVAVPLRVINSCVMTINLTNGVSKDVDCATDDVRATVDFPIVSEFPVDEVAGHLIEVKGFNFTVDTKFEFVNDKGSVEATSKGFNNANSYYITLPQSLSGTYSLKVSNGDKSSEYKDIAVAGSMATLFEGSHPLGWDKSLGGWDLSGVSKLQITVKGNYGGWLGFRFQNIDGADVWANAPQRDFGPADGEEFVFEISGDDIPKDSNWYICGGTSGACDVIKVVAIY